MNTFWGRTRDVGKDVGLAGKVGDEMVDDVGCGFVEEDRGGADELGVGDVVVCDFKGVNVNDARRALRGMRCAF